MLKETLSELYQRDLKKIIDEIKLYRTDTDLWRLSGGISNSGGNLALHIIGNINHFIGANLGNTDFRRERDLEFSENNVSRDELIGRLNETISVLRETFGNLTDEDLQKDYPEELGGGGPQKTFTILISMLSHLNYHLGQINYHRRFISA